MIKLIAIVLLFFIVIPEGYTYLNTPVPYKIIEQGGKKGLSDESGNQLIPPVYDDLGWSDGSFDLINGVLGFREKGLWGLVNLKNEIRVQAGYINLYPGNQNFIIASVMDSYQLNEIFGLIDIQGKIQVQFYYTELMNGGKNFIAAVKKAHTLYYGIINAQGKVLTPFSYLRIRLVSSNILSLSDINGKIILVDSDGNFLSSPPVDEILTFENGYARIRKDHKSGLIRDDGTIILMPEYKDIHITSDKLIRYLPFTSWHLIDPGWVHNSTFLYDTLYPGGQDLLIAQANSGSYLIGENNETYLKSINKISVVNGKLLVQGINDKMGILNSDGSVMLNLQYDSIISINNHLILKCRRNNEKGWILADSLGHPLNDNLFQEIHTFAADYFLVKRNKYWGLINREGKETLTCKFDSILHMNEGLIQVKYFNEYGVLKNDNWLIYPGKYQIDFSDDFKILLRDYSGTTILNYWGDTLHHFDNMLTKIGYGYLEKNSEGKIGFRDLSFHSILAPEFDYISEPVTDSILLFRNSWGWGAVSFNGYKFFQNENSYDTLLSCSDGFIKVIINNQVGFIDINGKLRIANRYEDAGGFLSGLSTFRLMGKWGLLNKSERMVVQPFYDSIGYDGSDYILVKKSGKYGIIDPAGNVVIDPEFDFIQYPKSDDGFICIKNGAWGLIRNSGIPGIPFLFDHISPAAGRWYIVGKGGKYGLYDSSGMPISPLNFDHLHFNKQIHKFIGQTGSDWKNL